MKRLLIIFSLFLSLQVFAQEGGFTVTEESYTDMDVEMADTMRSNGKIYVVVGVVVLILGGLIGYAISIDRKLTRIEREVFKEKP